MISTKEELQPLYKEPTDGGDSADQVNEHFAWQQEVEVPLAQHRYTKWRRLALVTCLASIFGEAVIGSLSLVFALKKNSIGTFGFSVDAFLDILTTLVVIWRFLGQGEAADSLAREATAMQAIAFLFILSGVGLSVKSIRDLVFERKPNDPLTLVAICASSLVVFAAMATGKWLIGRKLNSRALVLDALNSACCCLLAAMVLISLLIFKFTGVWVIGQFLSLTVAAFLILYGSWCLYCTLREPKRQNENQI